MLTSLNGYTSPEAILNVQVVYGVMLSLSYFILVWDWLSNLPNDWQLFRKSSATTHPLLSLKPWFLLSRYATLFWCTFVVVTYSVVGSSPSVCSWFKYYPYGYSVVMLPAHLVMIVRLYSIYERSQKVLIALLALAVVDFAIQMSVNHLATSVRLGNLLSTATCFTYPRTAVFSLVFISPTVFHHILLVMTLFKSWQFLKRSGQSLTINPLLAVIRRDHILFVLAICLINFSNLVLSLQPGDFAYKLINQLPAAAFTQIFLGKIVFSLKSTAQAYQSNVGSGSGSAGGSGSSPSNEKTSKTSADTGKYSKGHKSNKSNLSGSTAYDTIDIKKQGGYSSGSTSPQPRSPARVQLPRDWQHRLAEEDNFTRLPPAPLRTPPFSSLPIRPDSDMQELRHQRSRSSTGGILVGREVLSRSDEDVEKEDLEANSGLAAPASDYETRTGGKTPESAFGLAM